MAEQGDTNQERTERATPKRREEARKKGNVAKSTEVNSAAILLVGMLFFFFGGGYMLNAMKHYSIMIFENFGTIFLNPDNLPAYINLAVQSSAKIIFPFLGVMAVTGVLVNFAQIGPLLTAEPLTPKLSRINPITGFKRVLFSQKTLVELIKGILKISIICTIAFFSIKQDINDFVPLMDQSVAQMLAYVAAETFSLGLKIAAAMILLAVLDYMFQKYDYEKGIRMTKQEVKEELKQMEGDPHVKARIRSIQREMARRRMMDDVPDADVIITNPIKVAVALKYAPKEIMH